MPVQEVAALLERWRSSGGLWARGRVLADGASLLRRLSPEERQTVARALARQGLPDVAERLEGVQPTAVGDLRTVADQLLSLQPHEIDALVDTLRDPELADRLATEAGTAAARVLQGHPPPPPSGAPVDRSSPPQPSSHEAGEDRPPRGLDPDARARADAQLADLDPTEVELADLELGDQELGDQALDEPSLVEVGLGSVDVAAAEEPTRDVPAADASGGDAPGPEAPGAHELGPEDRAPEGAAAARPDVDGSDTEGTAPPIETTPWGSATATTDVAVPTAGAGPAAATAAAAGRPSPVELPPDATARIRADSGPAGPPSADDRRLVDEVRRATTASGRLAAVAAAADAVGVAGGLALLDAVPDGWQRRRAADRLIDAGVFDDADATQLLRRFERAGDRTFVAGRLLDAGLVTAAQLDAYLPPRTVRRLAARQEA